MGSKKGYFRRFRTTFSVNVAQVLYCMHRYFCSAKSPRMALFGPKKCSVLLKTNLANGARFTHIAFPPPLLAKRQFSEEGGGGVYFEAPRGRNLLPPPLLYTPPPPEGYCQGWGGWACIKFGPIDNQERQWIPTRWGDPARGIPMPKTVHGSRKPRAGTHSQAGTPCPLPLPKKHGGGGVAAGRAVLAQMGAGVPALGVLQPI